MWDHATYPSTILTYLYWLFKKMVYLVGRRNELPGVAEDEEPADVERDGGELLLPALVDLSLGRRAF